MNFRVLEQRGLENARSPFRVVEDDGQEVEWVNRFLDQVGILVLHVPEVRSWNADVNDSIAGVGVACGLEPGVV